MTRPEWIEKFSAYCRTEKIRYALARAWQGGRSIEVVVTPQDAVRLSEFAAEPDLRVSFLTELSCFGLSYMNVRDVLLRAEEQDGVLWMNDADQALMLLMFYAAHKKSELAPPHLSFLQDVLRANQTALGSQIVELLGGEAGLDVIEGIEKGTLGMRDFARARRAFLYESTKIRGLLYWGLNIAAHYARVFKDWLLKK